MPDPAAPGLTAYPESEARLRRDLATVPADAVALRRPLARCDLADCQGMCCYDGVYLSADAAEVVRRLARDEAAFFASLGLSLPADVVVAGDWPGRPGLKTAVAPRPFSRRVADFPAHFRDTACVFLTGDGRCGLQLLGPARGRHPWHDKPFGCWLHPLAVPPTAKGAITLFDERTDPFRLPGYDGYVPQTHCGRTCPSGRPAAEVLGEELQFLGAFLGRDLVAEARGETPP